MGKKSIALTYHEVTNINENKISKYYNTHPTFCVTPNEFSSQILFLSQHGYRSLSLTTFEDNHQNETETGVILTFDDGFIGNVRNVLPVLEKYGFKAIFFILPDRIGNEPYMSWADISLLASKGMEIGSHGMSHSVLETMDTALLEDELLKSKLIIENKINKEVKCISFPHGSYNKNVINSVRRAGYAYAFTSDYGFLTHPISSFKIPRLNVPRGISTKQFSQILDPSSFKYIKDVCTFNLKKMIKQSIGADNYLRFYTFIHGLKE